MSSRSVFRPLKASRDPSQAGRVELRWTRNNAVDAGMDHLHTYSLATALRKFCISHTFPLRRTLLLTLRPLVPSSTSIFATLGWNLLTPHFHDLLIAGTSVSIWPNTDPRVIGTASAGIAEPSVKSFGRTVQLDGIHYDLVRTKLHLQ